MSIFTTLRFSAGQDTNGNPRRVYVTFKKGEIVATYEEEYYGTKAIKNRHHRAAYNGCTFDTSYREFKSLVNWKK